MLDFSNAEQGGGHDAGDHLSNEPSPALSRDKCASSSPMIAFGAFEVLPRARALWRNGSLVDLGSRAFDLLMTLLAARGEILSKEVLMERVWPTTTVAEGNLRVQLSGLRQALAAERWRIKTIPGRGYLFTTDQEPLCERTARPSRPDTAADDGRIVIIDMSPENRERLCGMLASIGARVESFSSISAFLGSRRGDHSGVLTG